MHHGENYSSMEIKCIGFSVSLEVSKDVWVYSKNWLNIQYVQAATQFLNVYELYLSIMN